MLILPGAMTAGCGLLPAKTYDGSEQFSEAHPDKSQPMPYMDPDTGYTNPGK